MSRKEERADEPRRISMVEVVPNISAVVKVTESFRSSIFGLVIANPSLVGGMGVAIHRVGGEMPVSQRRGRRETSR